MVRLRIITDFFRWNCYFIDPDIIKYTIWNESRLILRIPFMIFPYRNRMDSSLYISRGNILSNQFPVKKDFYSLTMLGEMIYLMRERPCPFLGYFMGVPFGASRVALLPFHVPPRLAQQYYRTSGWEIRMSPEKSWVFRWSPVDNRRKKW